MRPVRRHHRRRHGAGVVHPAGPARQAGRGRRAAAGRRRWAWTRRWWCTPRRWGPTSPSSSSTARVNHLVDLSAVQVVEREYPLLTAKEVNAAIKQRLRPQAGRGRRLHRHRRAHRRHRRDPQRQGLRGGEGPGVLPGDQGGEPRRPGAACRSWWRGRAAEKADAVLVSQVVTQRDAHLHNTREMSAAFREALPGRPAAAAGGRRPAVRRARRPPSSASTGSSAAAPRPARWPATWCTP